MSTAAVEWRDARLNARLKVALLAALILHVVVLIAVQLRAALEQEQPRGPITIQLQPLPPEPKPKPPEPIAPPEPAPKSAAAPRPETPAPTPTPTPAPTPAVEAPVPTPEPPVAKPRSQPLPTPPAPAETPTAPLPEAPEPAAAPQPAPVPVVANRPPPPPPVSRADAAAAAQQLARAALQTLAPTPDAGDEPTNFGAPVAAPADAPPAPVVSETQRPSVGTPSATYDQASNARRVAGIDKNLAAGSPPPGGSAPADGVLAAGTARGSTVGGGPSGVLWDGDGAGCGEPVVDPPPATGGIDGGGMTYHIEVQFRLDGTGLVLSPRITTGSGNSQLDNAVLSAARGMRFDCSSEARGRRIYQVKPGGR